MASSEQRNRSTALCLRLLQDKEKKATPLDNGQRRKCWLSAISRHAIMMRERVRDALAVARVMRARFSRMMTKAAWHKDFLHLRERMRYAQIARSDDDHGLGKRLSACVDWIDFCLLKKLACNCARNAVRRRKTDSLTRISAGDSRK